MDAFNDKYYDYDLALLELREDEDLKNREPICLDDGYFGEGDGESHSIMFYEMLVSVSRPRR